MSGTPGEQEARMEQLRQRGWSFQDAHSQATAEQLARAEAQVEQLTKERNWARFQLQQCLGVKKAGFVEAEQAQAKVEKLREALRAGLAWLEACAADGPVDWPEYPEDQMRAALSEQTKPAERKP